MKKTTKFCKICQAEKDRSEFFQNPARNCVSVYCKPCQAQYNMKNGTTEKKREYNKKWLKKRLQDDPGYKARQYAADLENLKKTPAKLKAKRFIQNLYGKGRMPKGPEINVDYIEKLFLDTRLCSCCSKELVVDPPKVKGAKAHNAASIDRIDNNLGYFHGNIAVICQECNTRKRDLTLKDLEMLIAYVKNGGKQ